MTVEDKAEVTIGLHDDGIGGVLAAFGVRQRTFSVFMPTIVLLEAKRS